MKIGIDARFLTHPQRGGFKTYSEQLIAALVSLDANHEYVLYVDQHPASTDAIPVGGNITVRVIKGDLPLIGMPWREQMSLAFQVARDHLDLFHAPCLTAPLNLNCPMVVTIHDMIWHQPTTYGAGKARVSKRTLMDIYYRLIPALAARRATAVITVSHAAKADIVTALGLPANRIVVTHEAAKPIFSLPVAPTQIEVTRARFGLPRNYLLAIGSADPRKNLTTLLRAYANLSIQQRSVPMLVIVWTHKHLSNELSSLARELQVAEQVIFLNTVSDKDLADLYSGADLFLFPSRYEGFGLPLLEAMACGAPVIAANNSSIPEIVGDAALLVNAEDSTALARAIERALANPTLQHDLAFRGLQRAKLFSWQRCAEETLTVYEQAVQMMRPSLSFKNQ